MIPVFLIDLFFTYFHINSSIKQAEQLLNSKGEIIAQQIAGASEFSLESGNHDQIDHLLSQSIDTNDIIFIAVYDAEGNIISIIESDHYIPEKSTEYSYYRQSIQVQDLEFEDIFQPDKTNKQGFLKHLGWVHMYVSKNQLIIHKKQIYNDAAIFFITMLLIAVLLTLSISRRITRPIYTLLHHLNQIETGQLGEIIHNVESNEIGDVQKGFNSMSQSLLANRMQLDQKIKTATLDLMNAVTNLEYNNRELAVARDNAQKADRVKTQFLANMSHEIRTPINGIKGFLTLLSKTGLDSNQQRYTNIITQSTSDLSGIVNEILDFSKLESNKLELVESQFDLYELVESTRDSLFSNILEKHIDLYLTIYSDTPRFLVGDQLRLKQILMNLIGNAIKFTDQGYVAVKVYLEDENEDQIIIRMDIEDSGIGISEENQKSLFKAFKQIESDSNRRFSGTGLGLVISKNLTNLMGGEIQLDSNVGSGSLFSVIIPFKHPDQTILNDHPQSDTKSAFIIAFNSHALNEVQTLFNRAGFNTETQLIDKNSSTDYIQSLLTQNLNYIDFIVIDLRHSFIHPDALIPPDVPDQCKVFIMHYDLSLIDSDSYKNYQFISVINSSRYLSKLLSTNENKTVTVLPESLKTEKHEPKHILIVDDNSINLALASELTALWGHKPKTASNARDAMDLFKSTDFDLILLDIQMPEVDGVELMQMMRKEQPYIQIPIVAITANVQENEKGRLLNLGFNAYISKPIDENKLKNLFAQNSPVSDVELPELAEEDDNKSIDFELTFTFSAKNKSLVNSTFSMLQLEIPEYIENIESSIELSDRDKVSGIMHKLQGVTCYVGLPRLKKLLGEYHMVKNKNIKKTVDICNKVKKELVNINYAIDEYNQVDNLENL